MKRISIVWVGDSDRREFEPIVRSICDQASVVCYSGLDRLPKSPDSAPQLLVLAQSYPGELAANGITPLLELWPQTRVCWLLGDWCHGLKRFPLRLENLPAYYLDEWVLPSDSHWLTTVGLSRDVAVSGAGYRDVKSSTDFAPYRLAAVYHRTRSDREAIADGLAELGIMVIESSSSSSSSSAAARAGRAEVDLVVWEGDVSHVARASELTRLRKLHGDVPIVAAVTFPRSHDLRWFADHGVTVLGRPFSLDSLANRVPC